MLASVATANTVSMPITTMTTTVCARATAWDPTTLTMVIATTTSTAKTLTQASSPSPTTSWRSCRRTRRPCR